MSTPCYQQPCSSGPLLTSFLSLSLSPSFDPFVLDLRLDFARALSLSLSDSERGRGGSRRRVALRALSVTRL
eukprot:2284113-Rhodomonas_salina.1